MKFKQCDFNIQLVFKDADRMSHLMRLWYFLSSIKSFFTATNRARCLIFGQTPRLLPYFMCANSKDSGETARMHRLAWTFAGRLCDKYYNLMSWLKWQTVKALIMPVWSASTLLAHTCLSQYLGSLRYVCHLITMSILMTNCYSSTKCYKDSFLSNDDLNKLKERQWMTDNIWWSHLEIWCTVFALWPPTIQQTR